MASNSRIDFGCLRQTSSSDESCITTNAGTPCSFAAARLHSRKYSRNMGSISFFGPATADAVFGGVARTTGALTFTFSALVDLTSQSDSQPQASQAPQV